MLRLSCEENDSDSFFLVFDLDLESDVFPPIAGVMPKFIAYIAVHIIRDLMPGKEIHD